MADRLILETTFLIDLEREWRSEAVGPATDFLRAHTEAGLCVTEVTAGEMAAGFDGGARERWSRLMGRFDLLGVDPDVCWTYGRVFRHLQENGLMIGANDLWIAAVAVRHELPLVTRNQKRFRRVAGLQVLGY